MKTTHFVLDAHETSQEVKAAIRESLRIQEDIFESESDAPLMIRKLFMDAMEKTPMTKAIESVLIRVIQAFCTWSYVEWLPSTATFMAEWLGNSSVGVYVKLYRDTRDFTDQDPACQEIMRWYSSFMDILSPQLQLDDTPADQMGLGSAFGLVVDAVRTSMSANALNKHMEWEVMSGPRSIMVESGSLVVNREYLEQVLSGSSGKYAHFDINEAIHFDKVNASIDENETGHLSDEYDEANRASMDVIRRESVRRQYAVKSTEVFESAGESRRVEDYIRARLNEQRRKELKERAVNREMGLHSVEGQGTPNPLNEAAMRRQRADESAMYGSAPLSVRDKMVLLEEAIRSGITSEVKRLLNDPDLRREFGNIYSVGFF